VSADKDVAGLLAPLAGAAGLVVATRASSARALAPEEVAAATRTAGATGEVAVEPDPAAAIARACRWAGADGLVVVTGSLFLVGDARRALLGEPGDPVPLSDPVGTDVGSRG
jgi:dihydrofolate synthase/folylpolyglutamate synthase